MRATTRRPHGPRQSGQASGHADAPSVIDNVKLIRDLDLSKKLSARAIRARTREMAGQACQAVAAQALRRAFADPRVRRRRRRRQGRRDPPRHRRARRAPIRDGPDRRADRRRARAPVPVALLAPDPAARRHHDLRSHRGTGACWSSASRAICARRRLDARLRRDQPVRGATDRRAAPSSSSSGCRSARPSSCGASRRARTRRSSASRSRPTTGATARSGTHYEHRGRATWSIAPAPSSRRGRWSKPRTSTTRGSRSCKTIVKRRERGVR